MRSTKKTPAKVNLFLYMTGLREDGYHLLYSCMQTISLYDDVEVEWLEDGSGQVLFTTDREELSIRPEKNTCVRAARTFLDAISEKHVDIRIHLTKRIPSQAGLGGGSSDAAAVLLALNDMAPAPLSMETLCDVAVKIGADVPFFLFGGTALCEGVGEIITPLPPLTGLPMLIMKPKEGVSTPGCYARFDEKGEFWKPDDKDRAAMDAFFRDDSGKDSLTRVKDACSLWGNDLEAPAFLDAPSMQAAFPLMRKHGAVYVAMSGSGSAVFGIFEKESQIDALLEDADTEALAAQDWFIEKVFTV